MTDTSVKLAWDAVANADHYEVYRDGTSIGTRVGTSYSDSGLTAETTYTYQVKAVGADGVESQLSNALEVTTSASSGSGE
ncbi:chitodextrinase [Pullulanibacillus pueri]|uniref:Fibronectin type-III domain-containing protein n=1 Tax=Pullulanibacillus pueri TaxID=1437324 RepID=A0A8J3EM36_9BACL|nr:chitodextrinase [Pullulanibacillus pueri]GGH83572.1 hypothetical protein GCM10007096_24640 [Pullulanibacillus pueri]